MTIENSVGVVIRYQLLPQNVFVRFISIEGIVSDKFTVHLSFFPSSIILSTGCIYWYLEYISYVIYWVFNRSEYLPNITPLLTLLPLAMLKSDGVRTSAGALFSCVLTTTTNTHSKANLIIAWNPGPFIIAIAMGTLKNCYGRPNGTLLSFTNFTCQSEIL